MIKCRIYIIEHQDEVFVKRLRKNPLSLINNNENYPPIIMEIKIINRVVGTYNLNYEKL